MVFNSYIFILVFFPLVILGYFLLNKISSLVGKIFLVVANILFYLYGGWKFMVVTCISVLVNMLLAFLLKKLKHKKAIYIVGIFVNVAFLFAFKYVTPILSLAKVEFTFFNLLLPLGISYYTFQQIAFLSSLYREEVKDFNVLDYLTYILFFPKIMMGPLVEYDIFVSQLNDESRKSFNLDNFLKGIKMFAFGLFKKVIIADTFILAVNYGFGHVSDLYALDVLFVMLSYTLQIYFDFSGYSDMACGISLVLNFDMPANFDSPYKAVSPRDFWKRWHISLTSFLRKYIYIPLGGNRKGKVLTCVNVIIVFLISGLWHGANFTFIFWGLVWGILCAVNRFVPDPKNRWLKIAGIFFTFVITNFLFLFFRAESLSQFFEMLNRFAYVKGFKYTYLLTDQFATPLFKPLMKILPLSGARIMILMLVSCLGVCFFAPNLVQKKDKITCFNMILAGLAITLCLFNLVSSGSFVYFGF